MQHNCSNPLISLVLNHPLNMFRRRRLTTTAGVVSMSRAGGVKPVGIYQLNINALALLTFQQSAFL
jgi:hypothetical protein